MKLTLLLPIVFATATLAAQPVPQQGQHTTAAHPAEAPAPIHNGLWWDKKSGLFQEGFITGYKSGSSHGAGHLLEINSFPASELIDGLNHFYKDYRNKNILVDDALIYVQHELKGDSDDKLKAELLKMRAVAAPSNVE